jgi:hypothetical protein
VCTELYHELLLDLPIDCQRNVNIEKQNNDTPKGDHGYKMSVNGVQITAMSGIAQLKFWESAHKTRQAARMGGQERVAHKSSEGIETIPQIHPVQILYISTCAATHTTELAGPKMS